MLPRHVPTLSIGSGPCTPEAAEKERARHVRLVAIHSFATRCHEILHTGDT